MPLTCQAPMQEEKQRKGPWTEEEDEQLSAFVKLLGERKWDMIARESGLRRSGKSCRMRWLNYLRPTIKRGHISAEEEMTIVELQQQWGNKWSKIAQKLPGRTDNEIKNYWRTYLKKKVQIEEEGEQQCKRKKTQQQEGTSEEHEGTKDQTALTESSLLEDLSSMEFPSSPFEVRFFDWMSDLQGTCAGDEMCFCYMACTFEEPSDAIFDPPYSLWDSSL